MAAALAAALPALLDFAFKVTILLLLFFYVYKPHVQPLICGEEEESMYGGEDYNEEIMKFFK